METKVRNPADEFLVRYINQNEKVFRPDDIDPDTGLPKMGLEEQTAGFDLDADELNKSR